MNEGYDIVRLQPNPMHESCAGRQINETLEWFPLCTQKVQSRVIAQEKAEAYGKCNPTKNDAEVPKSAG
jgi:hypothetical protein